MTAKFSWTIDGVTTFALRSNKTSPSCYTSPVEADIDLLAAAGKGVDDPRPLVEEDLHMLAMGTDSDRKLDAITYEWRDDQDVLQKDTEVIPRDGVSITITKVARSAKAID